MSLSVASHESHAALVEAARNPQTPEGQLALHFVETLTGLSSALRQTLADKLWAEIPATVQESGYNPAAGTVVVGPMVSELVTISHVIVSVPAGCTGSLQLGADVIPNLQPGVTPLRMRKLLGASDARTLTITGPAGPAALVLHGLQAAAYGRIQ
jgi:hypothetical protein